jgi:hypothetical protein
VSIAELSDAPDDAARTHLIAMADLLSNLPARGLTAEEEDRVAAGRAVPPALVRDGSPLDTGFVRLLGVDGRLVAVAETRGGVLHPLVVLM